MERRSPDRHGRTGPGSVPVPLWRAAFLTAGPPPGELAPDSSPPDRPRMERRSPDRHGRQDQARYLCRSGERRSMLPGPHRENWRRTPVLQTGHVWSAGLQTGTGDRTRLGTCAALESGAPYCRAPTGRTGAGLQFSRPATYGAPVSRPARVTGPGSVPVPLWRATFLTAGAPDSSSPDRPRMERRSPDRHGRQDQARYLCRSGERRSILPARRTPVLQTGHVWSAGLQTGTGDRTN